MSDSATEIHPLWQAAIGALQAGEFSTAAPLLQQLTQRRPDDGLIWHHFGFANFQLGNSDAAIAAFERAVALDDRAPEYHNNLGLAYKLAARHEDAERAFRRALAIAPSRPRILCNLGGVLYVQRRYVDAAQCYRQARDADTGCAAAWDGLGAVALAEGRAEDALAASGRAVELEPQDAGIRNNFGAALNEAGRYREAEAQFRQALAIDPRAAQAWCNLGYTLAMLERYEEAETCCRQALALAPGDVKAYSNLAFALAELGELEAARENCQKALALDPNYVDALINLSVIESDAGRLDAAIDVNRRALAINPDCAQAHLNLSRLKKFVTDDPDLERLRQLEHRLDELGSRDQMLLHFALGKAREDIEQYDAAFGHFERGNRMKRATLDYDIERQRRLFDALQTVFTADFIAAQRGGGCNDTRPIFIVGMPRSGTTLVEQILSSHPAVDAGGESKALEAALQYCRLAGLDIADLPRRSDAYSSIAGEYLRRLGAPTAPARHVTDKMPGNFLYLGLIHLALPQARIIHCRRDARDVCVSCYTLLFTPGHHYSFDLAELGGYYRLYAELMEHWQSVLPAGCVLDMRYEDLVADTEAGARRLLAHCGLEWDDACLRFFENTRRVKTASKAQVRAPIYSSSIGRWRRYEAHLAPLLQALGGLT